MSAAKKEIKDVAQEARDFLHAFKSLQLATANSEGIATASYAPFVLDNNDCFIVYVSELSEHTANFKIGKQMSVMLIESEDQAEHLFARKRMTFKCEVKSIVRDTEEFEECMSLMADRFGDFINFLKKMKDFHVFILAPFYATYVRGFAQAYEFEEADFNKIRHINDKGHKQS